MWPVRRLWKRVRQGATFLSFLLVVSLFSYGVYYLFDKQLVGGLLRHQQNTRRREDPATLRQQQLLLPADIFPEAAGEKGAQKIEIFPGDEDRKQLNYNVHIFYYGW